MAVDGPHPLWHQRMLRHEVKQDPPPSPGASTATFTDIYTYGKWWHIWLDSLGGAGTCGCFVVLYASKSRYDRSMASPRTQVPERAHGDMHDVGRDPNVLIADETAPLRGGGVSSMARGLERLFHFSRRGSKSISWSIAIAIKSGGHVKSVAKAKKARRACLSFCSWGGRLVISIWIFWVVAAQSKNSDLGKILHVWYALALFFFVFFVFFFVFFFDSFILRGRRKETTLCKPPVTAVNRAVTAVTARHRRPSPPPLLRAKYI